MHLFFAAAAAVVFACAPARDGDFGPAATIESGLSGVLAGAAIDTNGNALVAWQDPGSATDRQKVRYRPAGGAWSAPVIIGPPPAKLGSFPLLQFNADGSAIAVTTDGIDVWAADMSPGGNWSRPHIIMASTAGPVLVMNAVGDAAVVAGLAVVRRLAHATKWSASEVIPTPPTGTYQQIDHAALGPNGDLLVPMASFDIDCSRQGCEYDVGLYAARETAAGAGWVMSPVLWGPNFTSSGFDSAAVIDGRHHAAVIFENGPAVQAQIDTSSGWSSAVMVFNDPEGTGGSLIGVTVDAQGNASVALLNASGANFYEVVDGSIVTNAWDTPVVVSASDNLALAVSAFGTNDNGGTVLSWADSDGTVRVASRTLSRGKWRKLQTANRGRCTDNSLDCVTAEAAAINDAGQQIAAWQFLHSQTGPRTLKAATTK